MKYATIPNTMIDWLTTRIAMKQNEINAHKDLFAKAKYSFGYNGWEGVFEEIKTYTDKKAKSNKIGYFITKLKVKLEELEHKKQK